MKVNFEKTLTPCVTDQVILWHLAHGYVWNVREVSGRYIGVVFATCLCGDGTVIHCETVPGITISSATVLAALRKAVRITAPLGVLYATVPIQKSKLIAVLKRIGFAETTGNFFREGTGEIALLKFIKNKNAILTSKPKP